MKKLLTALALGAAVTATAHAQRRHTDRDFDGLKGPVKSVVVEAATLKKQGGRDAEERRRVTERVTYNADGNRADDEWYDEEEGKLIRKTTYRYAGGEKLAEGEVILPVFIAPVLPSPPNGHAPPPARTPVPTPKPTRPFSEKYRYKYDAAGRIREMTIEEHGRVRIKVVYVYKGASKETRSYLDSDDFADRQVDAYDARGYPVESTNFSPSSGAVRYKHVYAGYEFDARGNWIKRHKRWSSDGQEERLVEYRTITYF